MYRALLCTLSALVLLAGPAFADDDEAPRKIRIRVEKTTDGELEHASQPKIIVKHARPGPEGKVSEAVRAWLREIMPKKDGVLDTQAWFADDRPQAKRLRDHLQKHGVNAEQLGRWLEGHDVSTHVLHLDSDDKHAWVMRGEDVPDRVRAKLLERLRNSPWAKGRMGEGIEMGRPHVEIHRERWIDDGQGWRRAREHGSTPFGHRGSEFKAEEIRRLLERFGVESGHMRDLPVPPRPRLVAPRVRGGRGGQAGHGVNRAELEQIRDQLDMLRRRLDRALGETRAEHPRPRAESQGARAPDAVLRRIEELRRRMGELGEEKADAGSSEPDVRERRRVIIRGPDGKVTEGSSEELLRQLEQVMPDVEQLQRLLKQLRGVLPEPKKSPK